LFLLDVVPEKNSTTTQFDALPPLEFFLTINKLPRIFYSVKTDEGKDAVLYFSLWSLACPLRQVPIKSMQHVLVANKKRIVQLCKNAVAYSR